MYGFSSIIVILKTLVVMTARLYHSRLPVCRAGNFPECVIAGIENSSAVVDSSENTSLGSDPPWREIFVIA